MCSRLILQIHDELLVEAHKEEVNEVAAIMVKRWKRLLNLIFL